MYKERIINGIEKVFEGYAKDKDFLGALETSKSQFELSPTYPNGCGYFLWSDGTVCRRTYLGDNNSSPRQAAEAFFGYLRFYHIHPLTLVEAKKMLEEDLDKRVEELKKAYARHFNQECDRQAENRYVQHPEA